MPSRPQIEVCFNWPMEPDLRAMIALVPAVPRIGETVGVRVSQGDHRILETVIDVRHYPKDGGAVHVLLGHATPLAIQIQRMVNEAVDELRRA